MNGLIPGDPMVSWVKDVGQAIAMFVVVPAAIALSWICSRHRP